MSRQPRALKEIKAEIIAFSWLLAQGLISLYPLAAGAQFAQPLMPNAGETTAPGFTTPRNPLVPGASNALPNQPAPLGPPEAPGAGSAPLPVNPGDGGAPLPPPSGTADPTHGNLFPSGIGYDRTTIYIYNQGADGRGSRMVQTIRPDQLSAQQQAQISGILGVPMNSGEAQMQVIASNQQLSAVQAVLFPYPNAMNLGMRKYIATDSPSANSNYYKPQNKSLYAYQGPLPTVKTFARYLVLMGVVAATIWMALAAYSVVTGNQYGGARVVSAVAGLMMLMAAYTIWKIVQMNTFHANPNTPAIVQNRPTTAQVSDAYLNPPNLPRTPANGRPFPQRMGIPLMPNGDAVQN